MQHPFFNAGQRRAKMYKTCIRSTSGLFMVTCQCNTPFLTQGSEEQKCTKRASVQPLVYLYLYVYRYVWQIYSCKEDRILYRLTFHSATCQKQPISYLSMQHPFFNAGQRRAKMYKTCIRSTSGLSLYLYVYRYVTCQCKPLYQRRAAKSKNVQNVHPFNLWSIYIYTYIDMANI